MTRPKPKHAMLLAAGRGERLRPHTDTRPKPLVEVAGRSLIDRQLDRLAAYGIERVVVNTHYLGEMIARHLASRPCPEIVLSREADVLETGGGVQHALPLLGNEPFFVMNSDVILLDGPEPALNRLARRWQETDSGCCLLLQPVETAKGYDGPGDFSYADGRVVRRGDNSSAPFLYAGVQIIDPRCFAGMARGAYSLNRIWDRNRQADGTLENVDAIIHDGDWLHVGDPEGLADAQAFLNDCESTRQSQQTPA